MRYLLLWFMIVLAPASAQGEGPRPPRWLHLNGYSHHFVAKDANAQLFGVGGTWYRKSGGKILRAWEADVFRDSGGKLSGHLGHSWTYTMRFVNLGATGSVMYHRNFASQNRWSILPVVLPYAEFPLRGSSLRLYYIPPVRDPDDHQLAVQLLIPIGR
jgi:hypothetical protein